MHLNVLTSQVYVQQLSACWNSVYRKIFHYKPRTSVRELMCPDRMNFEYLFYKKKLCFLHSMRDCKNVVFRLLWKSLCVLKSTGNLRKAYDFANVKPCDTKEKITYCLRLQFADSIKSDMNVVVQ